MFKTYLGVVTVGHYQMLRRDTTSIDLPLNMIKVIITPGHYYGLWFFAWHISWMKLLGSNWFNRWGCCYR